MEVCRCFEAVGQGSYGQKITDMIVRVPTECLPAGLTESFVSPSHRHDSSQAVTHVQITLRLRLFRYLSSTSDGKSKSRESNRTSRHDKVNDISDGTPVDCCTVLAGNQ